MSETTDWRASLPREPMFMMNDRARDVAALFARRDEILAASATTSRPTEPQYQIVGETALIPVRGALVNFGFIDLSRFGATSYQWIIGMVEAATADSKVKRLVLTIDSPGGMVAGSDAVVDTLRATKSVKRLDAHIDGIGASAAYLLASQGVEIGLTRASSVGSIGVLGRHISIAGALAQDGVEVTLIASGERKTDGNPYASLPDHVLADWQAEVDDLRIGLADDIAIGRGTRLTAAAALKTEARMFRARVHSTGASEAISSGLADRITTLRDMIASDYQPISNSSEGFDMTTVTKTDHDAAITAATTAERTRTAGILALPEAAGREKAAAAAVAAGLSIEQAKAVLAAAPVAARHSIQNDRDPIHGLSFVDSGDAQKPADASGAWDKIAAKQNARFVDPNA